MITEYGYSHSKNLYKDGSFAPITHEDYPHDTGWYRDRETAVRVMNNDLRWRLPTFLITRQVTIATPEAT